MRPIGYSKTRMGMFLAAIVCIGAGVLMVVFISSGASLSDMKYFGIGALVLAILCIASDITSNRKNKKRILHREDMLACPNVRGKVVEVKRNPYFFGKEFKETPHVYTKGKNAVYRIIVSVCNQTTGEEILITSEPYSRDVKPFIREGFVDVYYSAKEEYWIEL